MRKRGKKKMLIEIPEDKLDKNLVKIVKKINAYHEKGKMEKIYGINEKILSILSQTPPNANVYLYIISILAEEFPETLPPNILKILEHYLEQGNLKEKTNAVIILGWTLVHSFNDSEMGKTDGSGEMGHLNSLISLLQDPHEEIRVTTSFFLAKLPDACNSEFLLNLSLFLDVLVSESNLEIIQVITQILGKIQPKLTLGILKDYLNRLVVILERSNHVAKNDAIIDLLGMETPNLLELRKRRLPKKEILKAFQERPPLLRFTDLHALAEEEDMDVDQVEDYLMDEINEDIHYVLTYVEKHHKKMILCDKRELLDFLRGTKVKLDDIAVTFQHLGITNSAIGAILMRDLMDRGEIDGFMNKEFFYSYSFIKNEIIQMLRKQGSLNLTHLIQSYNRGIVSRIMAEIEEDSNLAGIYNQEKTEYFTYSKLTQDIENLMTRSNVVDLKPFQQQFGQENFLRLEQYCRDHFFTKFHTNHIWLTNLGMTRIQQSITRCEQIGEANIEKIAGDLGIPVEIYRKVVKPAFKNKNGFWNRNQTVFYFSKYVKKRIAEIQTEPNPETRKQKIKSLAEELQIDESEITRKVDEKLNSIAARLETQDEFEIRPLMRDLQMDYKELLEFIDSLNRPDGYLILHNRIIFSKKRIEEEKAKLQEIVQQSAERSDYIKVSELAARLKCAPHLIKEILVAKYDKGDLSGLWLVPEEHFITTKGIESRMLKSEGYIDLHSFLEEKSVTEDDILFLEKILKRLLEDKILKGVYDETNHVYQNTELAGHASLITERERFISELTPHIEDLERAYVYLKEILTKEDIRPGDIEEYDEILDKTIRKMFDQGAMIKRMINNGNRRLNKFARKSEDADGKKKGRKRKSTKSETPQKYIDLKEDEEVSVILNDFANWKEIIFAIEQKKGEIVFLKKKLKSNPEDAESKQKLKEILEYLQFN